MSLPEINTSVCFQNVADHMKTACDQIKNGTGLSTACNFNHGHFWSCLKVSSKKLSNEVTKLSLIYSRDPLPTEEEVRELLLLLEAAYVDSLSTFYNLPKEQGSSLHKTVSKAMIAMLDAIYTVVVSLKDHGVQAQKDRLVLTGQVWEACEAVESLPENNLQVLCKLLHDEEMLVTDALQEIEEEVKTDSLNTTNEANDMALDTSSSWSILDRPLLPPCVGLVKTARAALKKTLAVLRLRGQVDSAEQITELDNLACAVTICSPAIDDFISTMYPPINKDSLKMEAVSVVLKIQTLLKKVQESHYVVEDDYNWIDFLLKAVDHNYTKLSQLFFT